MTYTADIAAVGTPEHHWTFNNTDNDEIGTATANTGSGGVYEATPITTSGERTHSLRFNDDGQRKGCADQSDMNIAAEQQRRTVGGWFQISGEIPPRPITIWKEGGGLANITAFFGYGGQISGQIIENDPLWAVQCFGPYAALDRPYHWMITLSGSNFNNQVLLYVDGIVAGSFVPANAQPDSPILFQHSADIYWGDTEAGLAVGGSVVDFDGMAGNTSVLYMADWASWFEEELSQSQIRGLFEAGARPFSILTTDTQAAMQLQADALGALPDYPLCLEIEDVTGSGDLDLTLDGVTFSDLASLHIRWLGTGTLTLTLNGGSDPDLINKIHTPNGGTIAENVQYPLTVNGLQANSEVRIYAAGTQTELAGIENSGTSFVYNHNGSGSIDYVIFSLDYQPIRVTSFALSAGASSIPIQQVFDRNYDNP